MLDTFPIELIEHVVRLALSSSFLPHLDHDRLATLTSLCLVPSKLRTVVQPVLFEVVQFKSREGVESFLEVVEANKALGARVGSARFEGERYVEASCDGLALSRSHFQRLATSCPKVVDLRPTFDDKLLNVVALPALQALHVELMQSTILTPTPPSLLSHLEDFSCDWSDVHK
ncbi:hypothetical protein JCM8547_000029 [Rhodosporidiobolus lusitaniae]